MTLNKLIADYVKYNLWANFKMTNWLKSNDQSLLTVECFSSFPTILKTLHHMWGAQIFYLLVVLQKKPFEKNWDETVEGLLNGLVTQSQKFIDYVEGLTVAELNMQRKVETQIVNGILPQYELIQHCMNHSTFHRGQIITMGHQLGLSKAPSTDFFLFRFENR